MQLAAAPPDADFLPLEGIDHIHLYCGNAKQAAYFYRAAFGFSLTAYAGPETGVRDTASYLVEQGRIRLLLTSPLRPEHSIQAHLERHGDSVKDIALRVPDAAAAYQAAVNRGARGVVAPHFREDEHGSLQQSAIAIYGDTIHSFVNPSEYRGAFAPGFVALPPDPIARPTGLEAIDHVVGNVGWGQMNTWVNFYERVMGFRVYQSFDDQDISTEYSALMSKVMASGQDRIKFPINEPAQGRRKSQIEEYIDFHSGPGVQHIAMLTRDIVATVSQLQAQGIEFLRVPSTYYEALLDRIGPIEEPVEDLARLGILVDRDDEGYMLQIFTKPVQDRPTLFFEIIQRKGGRGFGKGNFKALFEAIEREQELRGNL